MSYKISKFICTLSVLLLISISSCRTIGLEIARAIQDHSQEIADSGGNNACHKASDFICEIEQEIHLLVNNHRKLNGKQQLNPHVGFSYTSRQWSNELANRRVLCHDGFPSNRYEVYQCEFKDKNVSFTRENVAYSSCNAKKTSS
jgi:uncharacterized protein YkwD